MKKIIIYTAIISFLVSCKKETAIVSGVGYDDWTNATHAYDATPNYTVVFEEKVHRIDIVIDADYWTVMQDDLESLYGGSSQGPPGTFSDENPIYVPCQVYYNDIQWYNVGVRYKGNSSLSSAYQQGNGKLPLRLEFNHFEDEDPLLWGQSFYGFQQLTFSSGYNDKSLIREKITPDVFRAFGVPAPRTAFYRVYVDFGEGATYFGLYTMVEVIFDTMTETQFAAGGNVFKPDGDGARLNDLSTVTSEYIINKTNEGDITDVYNMVEALISPNRTSNVTQWRSNLEATFDMPQYLKYLAANQTIANWDTYGLMTHNYYMYTDPTDGKLEWIPWDNNESLTTTGPRTPMDFDFGNLVDDQPTSAGDHTWPLLRYVYDDATYQVEYQQQIDAFILDEFSVSKMQDRINTAAAMIEPYAIGADGEQAGYSFLNGASEWTSAISELNTYVQTRWTAADAYTP